MYRDNTLIPTEAIRLAALGFLASESAHYADVAAEVRQFTSRLTGPNLDVLGSSIELLRFEGLIEAIDGAGMEDNARLAITDAGRQELETLLSSRVRTPIDGINKLIFALKIRYLHLLDADKRREQVGLMIDISENERARLKDLAARYSDEPGLLDAWIEHDIAQVDARIAWLEGLDI